MHRHFPWLVLAKMRWALFCAATQRRFRKTLDWRPFLEVADTDASFPDKLARYAEIAEERMDTAAFEEFRAQHLGPLDEVAWEYFGGDEARSAVRQKVAALYPEHEVDEFTDRFWAAIQTWRSEDAEGHRP